MSTIDIAIDFDGTCVTHEYPNVGEDIGAVPVLRRLVEHGHRLILFTMRSGKELDDAVAWFNDNDIILHGININPGQNEWTSSPKAYAHLYVDDAALGIPLTNYYNGKWYRGRNFVEWGEVERYMMALGYLPPRPIQKNN